MAMFRTITEITHKAGDTHTVTAQIHAIHLQQRGWDFVTQPAWDRNFDDPGAYAIGGFADDIPPRI